MCRFTQYPHPSEYPYPIYDFPGGLTPKVQPLDLTVNRSFKSKLRNKWEKWMREGYHTYTKSNIMRKATYSEVCNWIKECWDEITTDCVKNGFKSAGICDYETEFTLDCDVTNDADCDEDEEEMPEELLQILETFETHSEFDGFD
jgi:hypothetical protein